MPKQVQKQKPAPQEKKAEQAEPKKADVAEVLEHTDELLGEIDELLDDILGEESAQDFVAAYRQKGGQ